MASTLQIAETMPSLVPTAAKRGDAKQRARASAEEYESVFLSTMLKQMFTGIETKGPFHGGSAEETWRGMLIDQYGAQIAKSGGIGIADAVYREMMRIQEGARP
jgi:flagellar protein FlgJ